MSFTANPQTMTSADLIEELRVLAYRRGAGKAAPADLRRELAIEEEIMRRMAWG